MPLPDGSATFEDFVTILQNTTNPADLLKQLGVARQGFADLGTRVRNLEMENIDHLARLTHLEGQQNTLETAVDGYKADRDTYKREVDEAVKVPNANSKRIDDLEKRIRTVEGAVGSTTFKPAVPPKPDVPVVPDAPTPAPTLMDPFGTKGR